MIRTSFTDSVTGQSITQFCATVIVCNVFILLLLYSIYSQSESDPTVAFLLFLAVRCLMMISSSLLSSSLSSLFDCLLLRFELLVVTRLPVRLFPRPAGRRLPLLTSGSSFVSSSEKRSLNFFFCESLHTCCTCCSACCMLS